jgi:hypothetical protein
VPLLAVLCLAAIATAGHPVPAGGSAGLAREFSDAAVGAAIDTGVKYLWSIQKDDGSWEPFSDYKSGPTAMAVYALLESGESVNNPKIKLALDWLGGQDSNRTYEIAFRCNAWSAAIARGGPQYKKLLDRDAKRLCLSSHEGAYGYESSGRPGSAVGDNSNSQIAMLGTWMAAGNYIELPDGFWQMAMRHWLKCQNADGGWTYALGTGDLGSGESTGSMTTAGIASVLACMDNLQMEEFLKCTTPDNDATRAVERGMGWLEKNLQDTLTPGSRKAGLDELYYYYGIERVGLAGGYKYFGSQDWYKIVGKRVLDLQQADGSWVSYSPDAVKIKARSSKVAGTAFAVLFLIHGRAPILFNKLQYNGDWNCRPRDLANLCRWLDRTYERTVNWQVVNFKAPVEEWHDAPILYVSGARQPAFTPQEIEKLRRYVYQGGTIFSCAQGNSTAFGKGMFEIYAKAFPEYKMAEAPASDDIYTQKVHFDLHGRPKFCMISNGIRPLVIHTDEDLSASWQMRAYSTKLRDFQAAGNLSVFFTDKRIPRSRGSHVWPEEVKSSTPATAEADTHSQPSDAKPQSSPLDPVGTASIVRLKWDGNWSPEPLALERFSRLFAAQTHINLEVLGPLDAGEVGDSHATVAVLSGTGQWKPTAAQCDALKKYVTGGGTLVVDPAGGDEAFANSAREALNGLGQERLSPVEAGSPIYNIGALADGAITKVKYRAKTLLGMPDLRDRPELKTLSPRGSRPGIIFSRVDLTNAGLVGYYIYGVDGYDPGDGVDGSAYRLMRNIVINAMGEKGCCPPAGTR